MKSRLGIMIFVNFLGLAGMFWLFRLGVWNMAYQLMVKGQDFIGQNSPWVSALTVKNGADKETWRGIYAGEVSNNLWFWTAGGWKVIGEKSIVHRYSFWLCDPAVLQSINKYGIVGEPLSETREQFQANLKSGQVFDLMPAGGNNKTGDMIIYGINVSEPCKK